MRSRTAAFALGIFVVQLVLAATVFSAMPHTGGDNAGYVALGYSLLERGQYLDLHDPAEPPHVKYPPVYPATLALAMAAGARAWSALKAMSAVFMALAAVLAFLWIERRRGPVPAACVALLLVLSEAFLWHTHWVLSDPLFLLFTLAGIYALDAPDDRSRPLLWIVMGAAAAVLAFFTRSAGLPLVLAVALWLALERRWKALAGLAVGFGVPALAWWLRARGLAEGGYVAEFWLVDPYRPGLGTVGVADLAGRVSANLQAYVSRWIPGGIVGLRGGLVTALGVVMAVLAGAGWLGWIRRRRGVAELFLPLYLGLILLWPVVWAGDRFALPLYPLVLFYAGDTLWDLTGRLVRPARVAVVAAVMALLVAPALYSWNAGARDAEACRDRIRADGSFGCYQSAVKEFSKAAEWSGRHLGTEDRVYNRKPRMFYVLSGIQGRVFPLTQDPAVFLDTALSDGMTHVVMDYLDRLGAYYLVPVIEDRTAAFCSLVGFGDPTRSRTEIFGVLPPSEWTVGDVESEQEGAVVVNLRICEGSPPGGTGSVEPPYGTDRIPLLDALDRP